MWLPAAGPRPSLCAATLRDDRPARFDSSEREQRTPTCSRERAKVRCPVIRELSKRGETASRVPAGTIARYVCREGASTENVPVPFVCRGRDDICCDPARAGHGAKPAFRKRRRRRWNDLGDWFTETRHPDRLSCLADTFHNRETRCLEFGDRDFFHA